MAFALILSVAAALLLLTLLARYARSPAELEERRADPQTKLAPQHFHDLVLELLPKLGLRVREVAEPERDGALRIEAVGDGALRNTRHVIYAEGQSAVRPVGPETVLELAEDADQTGHAVGVLISTSPIDRVVTPGLDVELELIDGQAFRRLVAKHLPHRAHEVARMQLTGWAV